MTYLGIDLGTSGLRLVLCNENCTILADAEAKYTTLHPHPGWSEQHPQLWIEALEEAITEIKSKAPEFADLRGIAVSGHMHGATLINKNAEVLRPCILWNDTRAHLEAAHLDQLDYVRLLSGNIVFPGFTAPKLEWVRKNEPAVFQAVHKVLLPAAYVNHYLTGKFVADMSDSAGTSWLDVGCRDWSERLLRAGNMRREQMPGLVEGSELAGDLASNLKRQWGLRGPVIVAGGAGDNAAAACGIGALDEGQGFVSLGTSGVLLVARDSYAPAPESALHTFCHAVPERWYQMGVMLAATDCLEWLSRITGVSAPELTHALGTALRPPSNLRFLPYLSGERTPHNDARIRASFTGIGIETTREDLTHALLQGVAHGLRDSLIALKSAGAKVEHLFAIGGGSASRYWVELVATVLGLPLSKPKKGEIGAALGAARLAILAQTKAAPQDVLKTPEVAETIDPIANLQAEFSEAHEAFKNAYPAVRAIQ